MSTDNLILKALLTKDFYESNKDKLHHSLFDDDIADLYEIVAEAHSQFPTDEITTEELLALWQQKNPVATRASTQAVSDLIGSIGNADPMSPEIASNIIEGLWRRRMGRKIANLGIAMAEGKHEAFGQLQTLLEQSAAGFLPTDFGQEVTTDLEDLLMAVSDDNRFRFNIPSLSKVVYGPGRGDFGILFARPETGKTALATSLLFGPNGFLDQGCVVAQLGNEEAMERTMVRAYSCYTGMTKEEILRAPHLAIERFAAIKDRVHMMNIMGWDTTKVEAYIKEVKADVVMIDQGDKVGLPGNYTDAAKHEKLRDLYTSFREIAKRTNSALFAVSQASAEAEGKTVVTPDMMEYSKTGKYAEADIIIGVGKYPDNADGSDDPIRFLTIGKNKITGYHGTLPVKLDKYISRYSD